MTPKEMQIECDRLRREIGPKADVSVLIQDRLSDSHPIHAAIYAVGIGSSRNDGYLAIEADTFEEAIVKMRAAWALHSAQFRAKTVRKMALAIITITTEQGRCTDAALRGSEFSADDVKAYGADAVKDANEIADKGPFAILTVAGANGAPDTVERAVTVN